MNSKLVIGLLAVLVVVASVDAQGRRRGGGRGRGNGGRRGRGRGGPPIDGDNYSWTRDDSGQSIEESATVITDKNIVIVKSRGDGQLPPVVRGAATLYDFNSTTPVAATRVFRGPCFVSDTTLGLTTMESELSTRNSSSSSVTTATAVALDGAVEPLTQEAADALFELYPSLRRFCSRARVVVTLPAGARVPGPDDPPTQEIVFFTFDSRVTLTVPQRESRRGGGAAGGAGGAAGGAGGAGGAGAGGAGGRPGGPRGGRRGGRRG